MNPKDRLVLSVMIVVDFLGGQKKIMKLKDQQIKETYLKNMVKIIANGV